MRDGSKPLTGPTVPAVARPGRLRHLKTGQDGGRRMDSRPEEWTMKRDAARAPEAAPSATEEARELDLSLPDSGALVRHPDGYYWLSGDGRIEVGPYPTAEAALADMHRAEEEDIEPDETLPEAEQALGLSDWVDPDTGELAEATHTRIEDH